MLLLLLLLLLQMMPVTTGEWDVRLYLFTIMNDRHRAPPLHVVNCRCAACCYTHRT